MSDSSEDEDLSKFREAVDLSFACTKSAVPRDTEKTISANEKPKSERYLEIASHYNDVKVSEILQKQIGAKVSKVINKIVEFVDVDQNGVKKRKIKGGVKLLKDSNDYLSSEDPVDTYTEEHNRESRKLAKKRKIDEDDISNENDKIESVVVSGEYIQSKEETKCWKSRRKEKLFKYKSQAQSKSLIAIE